MYGRKIERDFKRGTERQLHQQKKKKGVSVSVCHVCMMPGKEEFIKLDQNRLSSANTTSYWYLTSECKCPKICMWLLRKFFLFRAERLCSLSPPPLSAAAGLTCIYTVICTPESKQQQHTRTHLHMWRKADTQTPSGECDTASSVWAGKHIKDKNESGMPAVALEASGGEKQSTARSAARSEQPCRLRDCWWSVPKGFYCGEVGFRAFSGAKQPQIPASGAAGSSAAIHVTQVVSVFQRTFYLLNLFGETKTTHPRTDTECTTNNRPSPQSHSFVTLRTTSYFPPVQTFHSSNCLSSLPLLQL